jgi:hypothetical protein
VGAIWPEHGRMLTVSTTRAIAAIAFTALLTISAVGVVAADDELQTPIPERVLFIGNSHTNRHGGMDWLVGNLVRGGNPEQLYEGARRTSSGVTLHYHQQNGAPRVIRDGGYDAVVLQGHLPAIPSETSEPFMEAARKLHAEVQGSGAETVFYMTWPQTRFSWADLDDIVAAHRQIAAELDVAVAPAGLAFARALEERPDLVLIENDQTHATWEGAYLAAATVYATLFGRTPVGNAYAFGVTPDDAEFLQRIAWDTVTEWQSTV